MYHNPNSQWRHDNEMMAGLKSNPVDAVHSALGGSCLAVTGTVFFELSALRLGSGKHTLSATIWNRSYAVCRSIHAEEMCRAIQATQNNQGWCSQVHQRMSFTFFLPMTPLFIVQHSSRSMSLGLRLLIKAIRLRVLIW